MVAINAHERIDRAEMVGDVAVRHAGLTATAFSVIACGPESRSRWRAARMTWARNSCEARR
jgi:hypothetical protein